jgi:hypothetical protein
LAVEPGLLVASAILEDEVTRRCGTRYQRRHGRSHTRYVHQRGVAADPGDDQSDRKYAGRETTGDGPCDAVAGRPHATYVGVDVRPGCCEARASFAA